MAFKLDAQEELFLRGLAYLKFWPVEKLTDNPTFCKTQKFRSAKVIVEDSRRSDWIYIIKLGKVTILKKLTVARESFSEKPVVNRRDVGLSFSVRKQKMRRVPVALPEEPTLVYKNKADLEIKLERSLPGLHNPADRLGLIDYEEVEQRLRSTYKPSKETGRLKLPQISSNSNLSTSPTISAREDNLKFPDISKSKKGVYLSLPGRSSSQSVNPNALTNSSKDRSTVNASLSFDGVLDQKIKSVSKYEKSPVFIAVQELESGQCFGLSDLVLDDQPSLSLVSNGAECILLSKSYFIQHLTDTARRALRRSIVPYPNEEELQRKLQDHFNWQAHKKLTYNRVVELKRRREVKKKQFVPQYMGQYNHRTGPI